MAEGINSSNIQESVMIKLTKVYARPTTLVEFFDPKTIVPPPILRHMKTTYIETGKIVSIDHALSTDNLTLTTTVVFESQTSLDAFVNDETIKTNIFDVRTLYNEANGITETTTTETI